MSEWNGVLSDLELGGSGSVERVLNGIKRRKFRRSGVCPFNIDGHFNVVNFLKGENDE